MYKVCDNFQRMEGYKIISPHHSHPTNGVGSSDSNNAFLSGILRTKKQKMANGCWINSASWNRKVLYALRWKRFTTFFCIYYRG